MIANYHTHTRRCNHAAGTEEEYVQQGLKRGLTILGFADHSPYVFPKDYYSHFRMRLGQLDDYISKVLELREKYRSDIQIPLGLETEYYPAYFPELLAVLRDKPIDYLILGQHFLGNEINDHYNGDPTEDESLLIRYCDQVIEAMQTGFYTYLAHPDLMNFRGDGKIYDQQMRRICREANACRIPLEINLLGLKERRHYPNRRFWTLAAEEGNQVVLGCDAHRPEALADVETEREALAMVSGLGLNLLQTVPLRAVGK